MLDKEKTVTFNIRYFVPIQAIPIYISLQHRMMGSTCHVWKLWKLWTSGSQRSLNVSFYCLANLVQFELK